MFQDPVAAIIFFSVFGVVVLIIIATIVHQFRYVIWSGYMRVNFTGEDRRGVSFVIKANSSDSNFELKVFDKVHKYELERDRIYRTGRFRLPTAYYVFGDSEPIDMLKTGEKSDVSAVEYAQVARNTVTRDLLSAFNTQLLSAQNIFLITIGVVAIGLLALGIFTNQKFETLTELHARPVNTGNVPTSEDTLNAN